MSFSQQFDSLIAQYISAVSDKFGLKKQELQNLWNAESVSKSAVQVVPEVKESPLVNMTDLSMERLMKCNKAELTALCKSKGLKVSGKKEELIERLTGGERKESVKRSESEKEVKESKTKPKTSTKPAPIIQKLLEKSPVVALRKNAFGNYEHPGSGMVFNMKTKKVIGKQQDDGTVQELTEEDIEYCKKHKMDFEVPNNLDKDDDEEEEVVLKDDDEEVVVDDDEEEILEDDEDEVELEDEDE